MRVLLASLVLVAHSKKGGPIEGTDATFDGLLNSGKSSFVKFLAPW